MTGKCWIYKRATLYTPGQKPKIIDYSDGHEEFDCVPNNNPGEALSYTWNLPDQNIDIPLNVPRNHTESIVRTGNIPYGNGEIKWEFIFGKYRNYSTYYLDVFKRYFLVVVLFVLALYIYKMKFEK